MGTSLQAGGCFFPFNVLALRNEPIYWEEVKKVIAHFIKDTSQKGSVGNQYLLLGMIQ